jgi:hypothetical protein
MDHVDGVEGEGEEGRGTLGTVGLRILSRKHTFILSAGPPRVSSNGGSCCDGGDRGGRRIAQLLTHMTSSAMNRLTWRSCSCPPLV